MIYQIATIVTTILAGIALGLNYILFRKNLKHQQATLLAELVSKNLAFFEKQKEFEKAGKLGEFCVIFLNQLELIAYLINNEYIPLEMSQIYKALFQYWYDEVLMKQRDKLSKYHQDQPEAFKEIEKLCKKYKDCDSK